MKRTLVALCALFAAVGVESQPQGTGCATPLQAAPRGGAIIAPRKMFVDWRGTPTVGDGIVMAPTGAENLPFKTLNEAAAAIRSLPVEERCGMVVSIAPGSYGGTANLLRLTEEDSGCEGAPIVYRAAADANSPVIVHAGVELAPASFTKAGVTADGYTIWASDLAAAGLSDLANTSGNFQTGWECANGDRTEFFFNGTAMTLARHPNKAAGPGATWQYMRQGAVLGATSFVAGTDDSAGGLPVDAGAPFLRNLSAGAWAHGYWTWDWADSFAPLAGVGIRSKLSPQANVTVKLREAPAYGLKSGSRYVLLNSRSMLDAPGEYYIDSEEAVLFFIPPVGGNPSVPSPDAGAGAYLSQRQHVHSLDGSSHVTLLSLRLEFALSSAVSAKNVTGVSIINCTVANSGTAGVELTGLNSSIVDCDIFSVGCDGVAVSGGDPVLLQSSGLRIHNNKIHGFSRVSRTIRPGIAWGGCGLTVSSNEIYDAPHSGIMIAPASDGRGVNCLFEGNDLHDLCKGTADAGGFYAGRTWANRGNIIRGNTFRDFVQTEAIAQAVSVNGIYLDDMESGWTVEGNLFQSAGTRCMFIGGGRQTIVRNNTFVNCSTPVHVDTRGLGWMHCGPNQTCVCVVHIDMHLKLLISSLGEVDSQPTRCHANSCRH